jgi:hypothetical protein
MNKLLLLIGWLLLVGCSREAWRVPMAPDTTTLLLPQVPTAGKIKFTGPVNIIQQHGTGNVATPTATAKVKANAAAIGPATATSTKSGGTPWWVYAVVLGGGALVGFVIRGRL